jgi:hypothetical protein
MRAVSLATAAFLIAATASASALPLVPSGLSAGNTAIVQVQDKKPVSDTPKKGEGITAKVKRAWKKLTGYHFDVSCLSGRTTCSETGKSQGDAQSKCIAKHPACWVESKK